MIGLPEVSATWIFYKKCREQWEWFPKSVAATEMLRKAYGQWFLTEILYWKGK
jgi:hypothetical protein